MAATQPLDIIKTFAKKLARAQRIKHADALDLSAQELGHPHWHALTSALKRGWNPTPAHIEALQRLVDTVNPLGAGEPGSLGRDALSRFPGVTLRAPERQPNAFLDPFSADDVQGELDGHPFWLLVDLDEVIMDGRGWRIVVGAAPSASPKIHVTDRRIKSNPIRDKGFHEKALRVVQIRVEQVRARIASDWPRRSTVPDAQGNAQHPLFDGVADRWSCLHCDQVSSGTQMAENLWYCPACNASPIDIHLTSEFQRRSDPAHPQRTPPTPAAAPAAGGRGRPRTARS